jgi:hypothetical protein
MAEGCCTGTGFKREGGCPMCDPEQSIASMVQRAWEIFVTKPEPEPELDAPRRRDAIEHTRKMNEGS